MTEKSPRQIGRYAMYDAIASGGMATVHLGRLAGAAGFSRTVAIKVLRPQFTEDAEFVAMFVDEARLAARIHHPNVVPTLDVIANDKELFSVMEYVHGEALSRLVRGSKPELIPLGIVSSVMRDVLLGLNAAHESTDERGESLGVVHRDVSPQNVIVGADGVARVLDFGIAKAAGRTQTTREGQLKGKLAYMAPEQLGGEVTASADIFAASIVLWECLTTEKLFKGTEGEIVYGILHAPIPSPREHRADIPEAVAAVVVKGLQRAPGDRFKTAREMADALVAAQPPASYGEVGKWVAVLARRVLDERQSLIREIESSANVRVQASSPPGPIETRPPRRRLMLAAIAAALVTLAFVVAIAIRGRAPKERTASAEATTAVASPPPPASETPTVSRGAPPNTASAQPAETTKRKPGKPETSGHAVPTHASAIAPDHI